jgi:hypothetical protein
VALNQLLRIWSAVMMVLAVLVVVTALLQAAGTIMLVSGALPDSGQPGGPSGGTLALHLALEVLFIGLGIWLFRFARKLRRVLRGRAD